MRIIKVCVILLCSFACVNAQSEQDVKEGIEMVNLSIKELNNHVDGLVNLIKPEEVETWKHETRDKLATLADQLRALNFGTVAETINEKIGRN
jgi:tetrahydromethanopterin S-methyltransferase subunit B